GYCFSAITTGRYCTKKRQENKSGHRVQCYHSVNWSFIRGNIRTLKKELYMFCRGTGILLIILSILAAGCREKQQGPALFDTLDDRATGLDFSNTLTPDDSFNVFHYMYFYNGAGIGAGDFNNDGLIDLYFASNQGDDKLYL